MRILAALALATAALAVPTAAWAYGSDVGAYGCYLNGGQVTRPAGTEIVVRQGWVAATRPQTLDFIPPGWRTDVFYPTGIMLGPGQSLTFHFVISLRHRVFDGFSYSGPGAIVDSTCTVTGA
jgi:hypothetical protein